MKSEGLNSSITSSKCELVTRFETKESEIKRSWSWYQWLLLILLAIFLAAGVVLPLLFLLKFNQPSSNKPSTPFTLEDDIVIGRDLASKPNLFLKSEETNNDFNDNQANYYAPKLGEIFNYEQKKIRGVNLGGWLVPEPFIVPSLFEPYVESHKVSDEWSLCTHLGKKRCSEILLKHYDTFLTEKEVEQLAKAGLNHVRIPIGYWSIDINSDEPYVYGAWEYLIRGIKWCRKYGIRVMIDFHAAPGSQNGWNHSGKRGDIHFLNKTDTDSASNIKRFSKIVVDVIKYFSHPEFRNVVTQIGVLNEPAFTKTKNFEGGLEFYQDIYKQIRLETTKLNYSPLLIFHEGFLGLSKWAQTMPSSTYSNVALDIHNYVIFSEHVSLLTSNQLRDIPCKAWSKDISTSTKKFGPTLCGEFSAATNDCATHLNGFGVGSRFDGTFSDSTPACANCTCHSQNDYKTFTSKTKSDMLAFVEYQMESFEQGLGWFFWNFKTETNPHWDYLLGWEEGWIPRDPNTRTNHCPS